MKINFLIKIAKVDTSSNLFYFNKYANIFTGREFWTDLTLVWSPELKEIKTYANTQYLPEIQPNPTQPSLGFNEDFLVRLLTWFTYLFI